jgi:hypothetical protein
MKTLGIFTGKQKEYNETVLTILYDHGPMSAWKLTSRMTKTARTSLHATLNKRLRELEKKGYVRREGKEWFLKFKGFIATLLILEEPRIWNSMWKEIYEKKAAIIEQNCDPLLKKLRIEKKDIHQFLRWIGYCLDDYNALVGLSNRAKALMENGVINFDVIKEGTLLSIILAEYSTAEELSSLWNLDISDT